MICFIVLIAHSCIKFKQDYILVLIHSSCFSVLQILRLSSVFIYKRTNSLPDTACRQSVVQHIPPWYFSCSGILVVVVSGFSTASVVRFRACSLKYRFSKTRQHTISRAIVRIRNLTSAEHFFASFTFHETKLVLLFGLRVSLFVLTYTDSILIGNQRSLVISLFG